MPKKTRKDACAPQGHPLRTDGRYSVLKSPLGVKSNGVIALPCVATELEARFAFRSLFK
jgi:hypothetical protein